MGRTGSSRSFSLRPKCDLPPVTATLTASGSINQRAPTHESRTAPRVESYSSSKRTIRSSGRSTPSKRWSTWWRSGSLSPTMTRRTTFRPRCTHVVCLGPNFCLTWRRQPISHGGKHTPTSHISPTSRCANSSARVPEAL